MTVWAQEARLAEDAQRRMASGDFAGAAGVYEQLVKQVPANPGWKLNLGITVALRNMEFKTFLQTRAALDYKGLARAGWVGDFMDPFTFLSLFRYES